MRIKVYLRAIVLSIFSFSFSVFGIGSAYADMGESLSHFESSYGNVVQTRPTSTGNIAVFKGPDLVIMAEFGPDGRARNVAYRTAQPLSDSLINSLISRSSSTTGSFYSVDKPRLEKTLDYLGTINSGGGQDVPPQIAQFASKLNPQVVQQLKSSIHQISDLRATHDGKYVAMINPQGSVMLVEINGPALPLVE